MILTVEQYRELSQTPGTPPSDSEITLALSRYAALIESYVGRSFSYQTYCETHHNVGLGPICLNKYPVGEVTAIVVDGEEKDVDQYQNAIHKASGLFYHGGAFYSRRVQVSYNAGFVDAPYDVKVVLSTLVTAYLNGEHGGTDTLQAGRKEVVQGVGSIDYSSNSAQQADRYAELGPYVTVLERYRVAALA